MERNKLLIIIPIITLFLFTYCSGDHAKKTTKTQIKPKQKRESSTIYFRTPVDAEKFTIGNDVVLRIAQKDTIKKIDSLQYLINNQLVHKTKNKPYNFIWNTDTALPGKQKLAAISWYNNGEREQQSIKLTLLSDFEPKSYTYKIINTYPHDKKAYTQGLFYADNILYESTGNFGSSSLRKVKLKTGKPIQVNNLSNDIFAEGICLLDGKIIQLTYKSRIIFVYDKKTLTLLREESAPTLEGWGITYNGTNLIMSDGTEKLYYLDNEYFSVLKTIEVYDNKGAVTRINELEYINGTIYANIYRSDDIVIIDPQTGKVKGRINMKGLLKPSDRHANIDVLNGIAYNDQNKHFYVTGKHWPKLFEVEFIKDHE